MKHAHAGKALYTQNKISKREVESASRKTGGLLWVTIHGSDRLVLESGLSVHTGI